MKTPRSILQQRLTRAISKLPPFFAQIVNKRWLAWDWLQTHPKRERDLTPLHRPTHP